MSRTEWPQARYKVLFKHADIICNVVDMVEQRCLAADGPVTPTLQEITEGEMRRIWKAANAIKREVGR